MTDKISRYVQIDDWIFEVKMVRALKVDEYGQPYSAIANCNINADTMYIDGLLTKESDDFSRKDFSTLYKFAQQLDLKLCSFHRYQNGKSVTKNIKISKLTRPEAQQTTMQQAVDKPAELPITPESGIISLVG